MKCFVLAILLLLLLLLITTRTALAEEPCIPALGAPSNDPIDVMFTRARADFEARRWEDAAIVFRYLAMHHSDKDVGVKSAPLYVEAINEVGIRKSRPACMNDIARDVPGLRSRYCSDAQLTAKNAATCMLLDRVQTDLTRLEAMNLMKEADKQSRSSPASPAYEKAGSMLMDVFAKHCKEPLAHGQPPRANGCDEMAFQASRAFRLAALMPRALTTLRELVLFDEMNSKLPNEKHSELAMRALYDMGSMYQAIGIYDQAADWYERYAKVHPSGRDADRALSDAVVLRLGLNQNDQALTDVQLFLKTFGVGSPIQAAQVVYALAAHHAEQGDLRSARAVLEPQIAMIDRNAPPDLQILAHTLLARVGVRPHDEYAKVIAFWRDASSVEAKLRASQPPGDYSGIVDRRMAKALNAVGEAVFATAEEHRRANVDSLRYPPYVGAPNNGGALTTHIQTNVKAWYEKRVAAIQTAEHEYLGVVDLRPVPPPKWIIAASSRVGLMWADLTDEISKNAGTPPSWMKDAADKKAYLAAVDQLRLPIKSGRAIPTLKKCIDFSVKYQFTDAHSRACEAWLVKNDKTWQRAVDEILPQLFDASRAMSGGSLLRGD